MSQGFGRFGGFGQTNRSTHGLGFSTQTTSVPSWNTGTAAATQPVPLWNQPVLTQPTVTTQLIATQPATNVPYGQAGGSNPPNNPPNNPLTGGLDPNVVALINAMGGLNWEMAGGVNPAQERELSLIRPAEFSGRETEDPNDWLERYNRIADANKWAIPGS